MLTNSGGGRLLYDCVCSHVLSVGPHAYAWRFRKDVMIYQKPELFDLDQAEMAILGVGKGGCVIPECEESYSIPAYEVDES